MSLCATCHGGCCRSFAVPVTGADILRIVSGCGLTFWDFAVRWADDAGTIARNYAPHFHFNDEPETPFVICLMQDESDHFSGTARCRFLQEGEPSAAEPLGVARCGIYGQRPSACRVFPAKMNAGGQLAILYDVPETGRPGGHPVHQLCPRQWTPADIDAVQHVQDLVVARYEMEFFHLLAKSWNRRPGPWRLFPDFLKMVYASRIRPAEEIEDATPEIRYPRIAA